MTQATKIGNHVFQLDDAGLANAIDKLTDRNDSLTEQFNDIKLKLDAAETAKAAIASELSQAQTSLAEATDKQTKADADIAALQTKLDAAMKSSKDWEEKANKKKPDADIEEELDDEGKPKKKGKPKFDSDDVKEYCKEFLTVANEVTPALKKVDSAFEPDFSQSPTELKASYLKTIETLPAEAKARIDGSGDDRDTFVEHLYLALKPQQQATAPTKADEGTLLLGDMIEKNRGLTVDAGDKPAPGAKVDSPTMAARKNRQLPSAYRK